MPNLAAFHPQIVHFVVVLLLVGVAFRVISCFGKPEFTKHAATVLLLGGILAAHLAVFSGTQAHGPVERIPGVRELVLEHEEHGKETRLIFFIVGGLELVALGLAFRQSLTRYVRWVHCVSGIVGVYGCVELYETADQGGNMVYSFAGGPGLRTGKPEDVERLLMAGLYNQSRADRRNGKLADAAILNAEMVKRYPQDTTVWFLNVESLLLDSKNPAAAIAAANKITVGATDARWRARQGTLKADAFLAMGKPDSARATLTPLVAAFPLNTRLKAKLDSIKN